MKDSADLSTTKSLHHNDNRVTKLDTETKVSIINKKKSPLNTKNNTTIEWARNTKTNVLKHSVGTSLTIQLSYSSANLSPKDSTITDNDSALDEFLLESLCWDADLNSKHDEAMIDSIN